MLAQGVHTTGEKGNDIYLILLMNRLVRAYAVDIMSHESSLHCPSTESTRITRRQSLHPPRLP
jgi:hypothetical protein